MIVTVACLGFIACKTSIAQTESVSILPKSSQPWVITWGTDNTKYDSVRIDWVASASPNPINVQIYDQSPALWVTYYNDQVAVCTISLLAFATQSFFYDNFTFAEGSFTLVGRYGAPNVISNAKSAKFISRYGVTNRAIYYYTVPLEIIQLDGAGYGSVSPQSSATHEITWK